MDKSVFFEAVFGLSYMHVFTAPKDSDTYGKPTQLAITFTAGYVAGVGCAVVSHSADSVMSLMGKSEHRGKGFRQISAETVGLATSSTKRLGTRALMAGTLAGLQW